MEKLKKHIVKSNNLIDCSYKLTLNEQRFITIACSKLTPMFIGENLSIDELQTLVRSNTFGFIEISVSEYKKEFGINGNRIYNEIENIANSLFDKEILYHDENGILTKKRWVITCKFDKESKKVQLVFHPDLIMDLLIFKSKYTKLDYSFLKSIKSFYAGRLYELLRQYLNIGSRTFELQDLRFKFDLERSEYPKYSNLKQKTLKPSIEWINANSDIYVDMEEIKKGMKVEKVKFIITNTKNNAELIKIKNNQLSLNKEIENESVYCKIRSIVNIDLTATDIDNICNASVDGMKFNDITNIKVLNYIQEKWELTLEYSKNKNNFNIIGFFIKALKGNWQQNKITISSDKFNNFESRDYDYDALEKMALGYEEYDASKLYK